MRELESVPKDAGSALGSYDISLIPKLKWSSSLVHNLS